MGSGLLVSPSPSLTVLIAKWNNTAPFPKHRGWGKVGYTVRIANERARHMVSTQYMSTIFNTVSGSIPETSLEAGIIP